MGTFTAAPALRNAFMTVGTSLWGNDENVLLTFGVPAFDTNNDCICIGVVTSEQVKATMTSNRRTREETLTVEVDFMCYSGGGQEAEQIVSDRAYSLLEQLEFYCRITDTTMGNVVRDCFLTDLAGAQGSPEDVLAEGRVYVLSATFTASNRISS